MVDYAAQLRRLRRDFKRRCWLGHGTMALTGVITMAEMAGLL